MKTVHCAGWAGKEGLGRLRVEQRSADFGSAQLVEVEFRHLSPRSPSSRKNTTSG